MNFKAIARIIPSYGMWMLGAPVRTWMAFAPHGFPISNESPISVQTIRLFHFHDLVIIYGSLFYLNKFSTAD